MDRVWCSLQVCGRRFRDREGIDGHLRRIHPDSTLGFSESPPPLDCETCGKKFEKRAALNHHRNLHTMAFQCKVSLTDPN